MLCDDPNGNTTNSGLNLAYHIKLYYKASVLETYGMNNVQTMLIFKI